MHSTRVIGVGAFVLGGLVLFAVGLFMIGERRMLFEDMIEVYADFESVAGLQVGSPVRVAGMTAGEVVSIAVPTTPAERFRVRLSVREDLTALMRTDSVATIQTDGLVGNKFIQVERGTERGARITGGATIQSAEPFDIADLLQQASDTVATVGETVKQLQADIQTAIGAVVVTAETASALLEEVGGDVKLITETGRRIATDVQAVMSGVKEGRGTIGRLLNDDELYQRAAAIARNAEEAVGKVRDAADQARLAVADFRSKEGPAQGVMGDVRRTLGATRETMTDLAEAAEALKRSFFFRGYFERRGFYDLEDVSPAEYRAGVLEGRDRQALRIWLRQGVLFASGPDATPVLTDDGRARLDSAMAELLPYMPDGVLMVEGYATQGTRGEQYLVARDRAELVRSYLIQRFRLDPQSAGLIVLEEAAAEPPGGQPWDGVAVTVFTPRRPAR